MPKIVDHEQYRKTLLKKSFDLLAEKGFAAVTMRQIADGLGVSTGTLYHYFPSKEALFEQLVKELSQQDISRVWDDLAHAHTLSDRIHIAFKHLEDNSDYFFKQMLIYVDFYQHLQREGLEMSDSLQSTGEQIEQSFNALLVEILGVSDPALVQLTSALIDGLLLSRLYGCQDVDFRQQAALLVKMLTAYFATYSNLE